MTERLDDNFQFQTNYIRFIYSHLIFTHLILNILLNFLCMQQHCPSSAPYCYIVDLFSFSLSGCPIAAMEKIVNKEHKSGTTSSKMSVANNGSSNSAINSTATAASNQGELSKMYALLVHQQQSSTEPNALLKRWKGNADGLLIYQYCPLLSLSRVCHSTDTHLISITMLPDFQLPLLNVFPVSFALFRCIKSDYGSVIYDRTYSTFKPLYFRFTEVSTGFFSSICLSGLSQDQYFALENLFKFVIRYIGIFIKV